MRQVRLLWQSPRRLLLLSIVAILVIQAGLFARSAATRGFATTDGGVKLWQVQSVLRTGRLSAPIDYPGAIYDPDHEYSPFVAPWFFWQDGQPYSEYTSPFIWVSAPLYALMDHAGLLVLPWLTGAMLVILSGWLAWQVRPGRSAVWAPIIVGLSSPLLVYSLEFWEHTPGAFLAVLALVGIVKAADSRRPSAWLMLSGAAVGLGLTMRAELYVFPVAVAIGLLFARPTLPFFRSALMLAVGGACVAGPWWIYQAIRWGHPLGPRIVQNVPVFGGSDVLAKLGDTTGRNWAMLWPSRGDSLEALAVAGIAVGLLALAVRLLQRRRVSKAASLHLSAAARAAAPAWWILVSALLALVAITTWRVVRWQLVVDQRPDDLLTTFPLILLLLLPARQPAWWQDWRMRFLAITSAAFALLVVIASPFQGGLQWGPRFLLPIISPLAVVIAARLGQLWQQSHRGARMGVALVFTGLLLAGSYSTWTGFQFMRDNQATNARLSDMIEGAPERVVVADAWFLPQGAPYTSGSKIWFLAEDQTLMFKLIQRLRKTTNEPGMIYVSSLTWTHLDPLVLMGPRIAPNGDPQFVDAPGQYLQITRYFLYK